MCNILMYSLSFIVIVVQLFVIVGLSALSLHLMHFVVHVSYSNVGQLSTL